MKRLAYVLLFTLCLLARTALAQEDRPNVVLMLSDNVGYGDVGAFQGGEIRGMPTPRIDQLASEGLTLTHFLTSPGCTPSRAALNTGRYAPRSGLGLIIAGGTPNTLQDEEITLAEMFRDAGYATGMTGKWHLGEDRQSWPTNQGFDEYRVGVLETTDSTLYRETMERNNLPEELISQIAPGIWEGEAGSELRKIREYDVEYRQYVERDIAEASVDYIKRHAGRDKPFFLYVGWTNSHYPSVSAPEFTGVSISGPYGDSIMELDHRTGQVLDAIEEAGIEDNTIVLWLSDDGPMPLTGPAEYRGGSAGIYVGETGDPREGSLRTPAMIKWPGRLSPGKAHGMVSIHDIFPTLAALVGGEVPDDRPIDGVDQSQYFLGQQENSNRESLLSFIGTEIVAVRWRHFTMYPKTPIDSPGIPTMSGLAGNRLENMGYPVFFNVAQDPAEKNNLASYHAWLVGPYMQAIGEYQESLEKYPNPPPVDFVDFPGTQ